MCDNPFRSRELLFGNRVVGSSDLVERISASKYAQVEFERVKKEKLQMQHPGLKTNGNSNTVSHRVRTNRASAAASRARIFCYARELEKCTDRLEEERNSYRMKSERSRKTIEETHAQNMKLRGVLQKLWDMKDPTVCSFLVDTQAIFLISPANNNISTNNNSVNEDNVPNKLLLSSPPASISAEKRNNIHNLYTKEPSPDALVKKNSNKNAQPPSILHYRFY